MCDQLKQQTSANNQMIVSKKATSEEADIDLNEGVVSKLSRKKVCMEHQDIKEVSYDLAYADAVCKRVQ